MGSGRLTRLAIRTLDAIAPHWEGDVLCFIEVKTRTSRAVMPAEAAVDEAKQRELVAVAREYLRPLAGKPAARFDILSIYLDRGGCSPQITLFRNAFSMQ